MDQSYIYVAIAVILATMPIFAYFCFRTPAGVARFMTGLTLWYNLFVLTIAAALLAAAIFFAAGMFFAPKHDLFFWVYMTAACLFGLFAFLDFATKHKAGWRNAFGVSDLDKRIVGLFKETAALWRQRFGPQAKSWRDVGPD